MNGQILLDSERGNIIKKILENYECSTIFEIGTWKGLGSTLCILKSMSKDSNFISLESNKEFFDIAIDNLKNYLNEVKLIYGTIVNVHEVENFVKEYDLDTQRKSWLEEDLLNINKCPNVSDIIPQNIDFLLLDGGEFSTYVEWYKLKDKVKIIAMDDIREIKCKKLFDEISKDINYKLLDKTEEGNGFAVFQKI